MRPLRAIAAAQTTPVRGDVEANIEQHVRLARAAAAGRPEVLVFPELSLTGYEMDLAAALAFTTADARLDPLIATAASCATTLVVGAPVAIGPRLHIGAFVLAPDRTVALYTKHHLGAFSPAACRDGIVPPPEATVFHPGDANPLVRFERHVAAVAVCADCGRPSHPQQAAARGATTYLASMFVIPSEFERESATLQSSAVRHAMAVVLANHGGETGGLAAAGRSSIWSQTGELLVRLPPTGMGVAIAVEDDSGWRATSAMP